MAFAFRLEHVLKHRKSLRDFAQKELAVAEQQLQSHLQFVNSLYETVDKTRQEAAGEQARPSMDVRRLEQLEAFVLSTKRKIEEARLHSRELMRLVEEKRDMLVEKAKEFRVIELLKEKKQHEYKEEMKKKEMKELDDGIQMRFKREKVS